MHDSSLDSKFAIRNSKFEIMNPADDAVLAKNVGCEMVGCRALDRTQKMPFWYNFGLHSDFCPRAWPLLYPRIQCRAIAASYSVAAAGSAARGPLVLNIWAKSHPDP